MAHVYLIPTMAASPAGCMYSLEPLPCISPDVIVPFCKAEIDYDTETIFVKIGEQDDIHMHNMWTCHVRIYLHLEKV